MDLARILHKRTDTDNVKARLLEGDRVMRSYVSSKFSVRSLGLALGLACAALSASMQSANAVPVAVNTWNEFGFDGVGSPLRSGIGTVPATNPPDGNPVVQ